jgi:hypothetical protein
MKGERGIVRYVEAQIDLESLRAQAKADPSRLSVGPFVRLLNDAKVEAANALSLLYGWQLREAQIRLATRRDQRAEIAAGKEVDA